ncbi:hypothetical protein ACHAXT_004877 [Thalassiosira profunda]
MGETVHVSLGTAANHVTSHLLNLQGLAATPSDDGGGEPSLCDPSVTHAVAPLDSGHVYVPRALIVDGKDSFGSPWGGSANNNSAVASGFRPEDDPNAHVCSWGGRVERFAAGDPAIFGEQHSEQGTHQQQLQRVEEGGEDDPLRTFQNEAAAVGLSPVHSRFSASPPAASYNAGLDSGGGRHVQWDEEDKEEEDDDYCYGQDMENREEEKRRQQERTEMQQRETRRGYNERMERAWEEAFYPGGDGDVSGSSSGGNAGTGTVPGHGRTEREIRWHDYWMPPRPSPARYQVPLPFDTANATSSDAWSSSFGMGYHPGSGLGGGIGTERSGITHSWRENALSESLRRTLEGCDVVKGFNVFVDGGASASTGNGISGGFHAGLATSLLEELSEECRSAGRWAVLIAPPAEDTGVPNSSERQLLHQFRRRLNAGLALHGLSSNADAFLPASIDAAHRALRGDDGVGTSPNRALFEGSAAVALALEASTLYYRLRRDAPSSRAAGGPRSRLGIQSGFYRGSSGNVGYGEADSEPFATAPSLTYHEFLASLRSSSDKRRSILELDALLRPLSYPGPAGGGMDAGGGASGLNMASLLAGSGSAAQASVLASLASAGLIGGGSAAVGELQQRMMQGTSADRTRQEQQTRYRSSRGSSARQAEPGEWMEDISTKALGGGGGLLSSLSGTCAPFGRRSAHHHFALSISLRPSASDATRFDASGGDQSTSAFLRPMMESMGVKYRPEVSLGAVVKDSVVDATGGVGSYWKSVFASQDLPKQSTNEGGDPTAERQQALSPMDIATHTPIISVLGNSTRSYPRIRSVSTGFVDALHSRRNAGHVSRDVMAGILPEVDDCEEALEHCRELMDIYEPSSGSGLIPGLDENDDAESYFA